MAFLPPPQVKETGEVAIAGGYVDIVPAMNKTSAWEPLKVGRSNKSLDLQSRIVKVYFREKTC